MSFSLYVFVYVFESRGFRTGIHTALHMYPIVKSIEETGNFPMQRRFSTIAGVAFLLALRCALPHLAWAWPGCRIAVTH